MTDFKPNHQFHTNYSPADDERETPRRTQINLLPLRALRANAQVGECVRVCMFTESKSRCLPVSTRAFG